MLLVLLLGIADFGRLFTAGITVEAAARDAAEIGALERLRDKPPDPAVDPSGFAAYYDDLHVRIAKAACAESDLLPNSSFVRDDDPSTPGVQEDRTCPGMPIIRACVRDHLDSLSGSGDPACGEAIAGFDGSIPTECSQMTDTWSNTSGGEVGSHAVEVRICYHFTTLFSLHLSFPFGWGLNLGDIWLQRGRVFALDCPPGDVSTC
jgi:hypothetical protein